MKKSTKNKKSSLSKKYIIIIAVILIVAIGLGWWRIAARHKVASLVPVATAPGTLNGLKSAGVDPKDNSDLKTSSPADNLDIDETAGIVSSGNQSISITLSDNPYPGGSIAIRIQPGQTTVHQTLFLTAKNIDLKKCSVTQKTILDDENFTESTVTLPALADQNVALQDGDHAFTVTCQGENGTLTAVQTIRAFDGQPKRCKGFSFGGGAPTATSLSDLQSKMVGTWEGCVTTPWVPPYYVSITFNADGTYSAVSNETIDGMGMNAMYYGSEQDNAGKKYFVEDFQSNSTGVGEIDIVFEAGGTNRGTLKNIKLSGDKLSFDFFHRNEYGPLTFQLNKVQ